MTSPVLADSSISLLLVEDDDAERSLLADALATEYPQLNILQAIDGESALSIFRSHAPEIVLADINMPVLDGIAMSRPILAHNPATHIIVISENSDLSHLLEAIKLGIKQYLLKPIVHDAVFEAISDCLNRIKLARQVRKQEEYIRKLWRAIEQSPAVVAITDVEGNIECINRRYLEMTGLSEREVLGKQLGALCGEGQEELAVLWKEVSAAASPQTGEDGSSLAAVYECSLTRKNGSTVPCLVSAAPVFDGGGSFQGASVMFTDISAQQEALEEKLRTQKLESLGIMAGGIAHDFNNVLTGVLGNLSFAQHLAEPGHKINNPLRDAEEAACRAAELARQLLAFARGSKPIKQRVVLHQLLEESVSLTLTGARIGAVVNLADGVDTLEVDHRLLSQAFSNILVNAAQAMPAGGTVRVNAGNVRLGRRNTMGLPAGQYVKISFKDDGCGIPEGDRKKIFDPYFSTKAGCNGLGLASAYTIMVNHGGHIDVRSKAGKGTTIICHLPCAGEGQALPDSDPVRSAAATSSRSVLIMDDENIVRKVAGRMLQSLGYQVTACVNGEQAVRLYQQAKEEGAPFLAVLMDLTIPAGMGGKEAARAILNLDPEARLVVSSGYFDDPVMSDYRDHGFCAVMPKPYKLADLSRLMERVSASNGAGSDPKGAAGD